MKAVELSQVAAINPRLTQEEKEHLSGEVAFLPMDAVSESGCISYQKTRLAHELLKGFTPFKRGDVIFAKITPCMENGKAAHLYELNSEIGFGSTEFHVIRPSPLLDARYLFHQIWNPRFRRLAASKMSGAVGQKRVPADFLRQLPIPLPPLEEQRRIAAILDKADGIRRKRDKAIELAGDFLRSSYIHLVGYRSPEFGAWKVHKIGNLAAPHKGAMRTGPFGSDLRHSEFVDHGIAVLGIDNAVKNHFEWDERRYISEEKYDKLRRYRVFPRDVIITIMGTTGRSAVVPDDIPEAITTKHLAAITCDQTKIVPEFLSFAIHSDPLLTRQIQRANKGAIMAGLNLGIIKSLEINLPPLGLQKKFSHVLTTIAAVTEQFSAPDKNGVDLFESLSQRAFRGDL